MADSPSHGAIPTRTELYEKGESAEPVDFARGTQDAIWAPQAMARKESVRRFRVILRVAPICDNGRTKLPLTADFEIEDVSCQRQATKADAPFGAGQINQALDQPLSHHSQLRRECARRPGHGCPTASGTGLFNSIGLAFLMLRHNAAFGPASLAVFEYHREVPAYHGGIYWRFVSPKRLPGSDL